MLSCELHKLFQKSYFIAQYTMASEAVNCHPEVFCKNGVVRNFAKVTGKHMSQSLFFLQLLQFFFGIKCNLFVKSTA